jgi:hypothetical protein
MVIEKIKIDNCIDYQLDLPYVQYLRHAIDIRHAIKRMEKSVSAHPDDDHNKEKGKLMIQVQKVDDNFIKRMVETFLAYDDDPPIIVRDENDPKYKKRDSDELRRLYERECPRIWVLVLEAEQDGRVLTLSDFYDIEKDIQIYNDAAVRRKNENENKKENKKENGNENENSEIPIENTETESKSKSESESEAKSEKNRECEIRVFEPYLPHPLESVVATVRVVVELRKELDNEMHRFEFQFEGSINSDNTEWRVLDIFYV